MNETLLVGAGYMAREYAKVLQSLKVPFKVIGRSEKRIKEFAELFPAVHVLSDNVEKYLKNNNPSHAIVAVNIDQLYQITSGLIAGGVKNILVEKPGALTLADLEKMHQKAESKNAVVSIAYNRRFYRSVALAKELIEADNGIISTHFEFTEWVHAINPDDYSKEIMENWVIGNSSHVIDLVFSLIGKPREIHSYVNDKSIGWHSAGAIFTGAGLSEKNIPFTYHSNWLSAGRWSIVLLTREHKFIFAPMEKLIIQKRGSVKTEIFENDYSIDELYKPGLYNMVKEFFNEKKKDICSLPEHIQNFKNYTKIAGYVN